jgi:hypothetical protein
MRWRWAAVAVTLLLAAMANAVAAADTSEFLKATNEYEHRIAQLSATDPSFPPALVARLDYGDFLAKQRDANCLAHVDLADQQRAALEHNVATSVLLPDGAARLADLKYRVAISRAYCSKGKAKQLQWRQDARVAAEQTMKLYASIHQYLDVAVAQFNIASLDHDLGQNDKALSELRAALALDQRYGLREDAEDNLTYLEKWQGHEATDIEAAELLNGFAGRTATLTFAWAPAIADWSELTDITHLHEAKTIRSVFSIQGTDTVSQQDANLRVSTAVTVVRADIDKTLNVAELELDTALVKILSAAPSLLVTREGTFKELLNTDGYIATASQQIVELPEKLLPQADKRVAKLREDYAQLARTTLTKDQLLNKAREEFNINTGMWVGSTLTQNRWLTTEAKMPMPGTPDGFLDHVLQYAFVAWTPCDAADTEPRCVELAIWAEPKDSGVQEIHDRMQKEGRGELTYWSRTRIRLIVDPSNLRLYAHESRRYAYIAEGSRGQQNIDMVADLDTVSMRYAQ